MTLKHQTVLLTGGAGDLGTRIARRLAEGGAEVVLLDRQAPKEATYEAVQADLATAEGLEAAAEQVRRYAPSILVNLAGLQHFGPFEAESVDHLQMTYMVNLVAPVRLAQAALPAMRARGSGQIVNVGSIFASINFAHFTTYSSSKAGLKGFSQALRRELAGSGVGVTYVAPRAIRTAFNSSKVMEFAARTRMTLDDPDRVADRLVRAIARRERDVYLGFPETLFVRLNALAPGLVDRALAASDRNVAQMFT